MSLLQRAKSSRRIRYSIVAAGIVLIVTGAAIGVELISLGSKPTEIDPRDFAQLIGNFQRDFRTSDGRFGVNGIVMPDSLNPAKGEIHIAIPHGLEDTALTPERVVALVDVWIRVNDLPYMMTNITKIHLLSGPNGAHMEIEGKTGWPAIMRHFEFRKPIEIPEEAGPPLKQGDLI